MPASVYGQQLFGSETDAHGQPPSVKGHAALFAHDVSVTRPSKVGKNSGRIVVILPPCEIPLAVFVWSRAVPPKHHN